jgi:hypothetical protein
MLLPVRQIFPHRAITDIPATLTRELTAADLPLPPHSRIAIGVGSRGVANLPLIVHTVVRHFQTAGHRPFLFPAMGSHGAGTAAGQAHVLAHYGIDESTMGCPVESSFDIVSLGRTEHGIEAFAGRDAWQSDAIFLINRIKWHTSFAGALESGVCKMMAIGLGKREGAASVHSHARSLGMDNAIRSVAARILASGKILGGLGILEDAFHDAAQLAVLPAASLIEREIELLRTVKSWMVKIPVEALDVLIVDEIGMDLKIVNRSPHGQLNPWPDTTRIERIFVRDLSDLSNGNATGIGAADVVHSRMLPKIDPAAGRVNAMTSGSLALAKTPLHFPTDRECFELAASTAGRPDRAELTIGRIRNTLELEHLALSESLRPEIERNPLLEITGPPFELAFNAEGQLS